MTGGNGAGKTSLCRVLSGVQKAGSGVVFIDGQLVKMKKRVRHSFFVHQDVDYQLYMPTVREEILLGTKHKADEVEVCELIEELGLADLLNRHPNTLSGGQKQRVLLAAAALREVPVIILDEPTSGLDGLNMRAVSKMLRSLASNNKSIFLITHDVEFMHMTADTIAYMEKCKIAYHRELPK